MTIKLYICIIDLLLDIFLKTNIFNKNKINGDVMLKNNLELLNKIEDNGFKAYIVGGYVRDYIMKYESLDVDICTDALPKDLIKIFPNAILPSSKYGNVLVIYKGIRYEITTFRKEIKYENRKPIEIEYTSSLEIDLERRDFTINSMCMDKNGDIIDLFDGKKDISKKVIRSLGDASIKFYEDPLRILRAIRFATIFNFKLDKGVVKGIMENAKYLKNISYDRKKSELNKIFASNNIKYGIKLINYFSLSEYLDINIDKIKFTKDILGIWAQLNVIDVYPFTKNEKELINNIVYLVENKTIGRYEIYKYGLYCTSIAAEILGINKNIIVRLERKIPIKSKKNIKISSKEILKLVNKDPGEWLSKLYDDLEEKIVVGKLVNDNDKIKDYIIKNY